MSHASIFPGRLYLFRLLTVLRPGLLIFVLQMKRVCQTLTMSIALVVGTLGSTVYRSNLPFCNFGSFINPHLGFTIQGLGDFVVYKCYD